MLNFHRILSTAYVLQKLFLYDYEFLKFSTMFDVAEKKFTLFEDLFLKKGMHC